MLKYFYFIIYQTLNESWYIRGIETVDGAPYPNKVSRNGLKELPDDFMQFQHKAHPQEWEVEAIKGHRIHPKAGVPQFKVKWRGLDNRHNSWRVWDDFFEKELLKEYLSKLDTAENTKLVKLIK